MIGIRKRSLRIFAMLILLIVLVYTNIATSSARYTTIVSTDTANKGATWWFAVQFNDQSYESYYDESANISLANTADANTLVTTGKLAPGTSKGNVPLGVDCKKCEVNVTWKLYITKRDAVEYPENVVFYIGTIGEDSYTELPFATMALSGDITHNTSNKNTQMYTIPLKWRWKYTEDNENRFEGIDYYYVLRITAEQKIV